MVKTSWWPLAAIVTLFFILTAVYSLVIPLFEAPDEVWHFSFVQRLAVDGAIPIQPTEGKDMWLREVGQPPLYHALMALLVAPLDTADFPAFVRFNPNHPFVTPTSTSEAPNLFIHTRQEDWPYQGAVLAVHLVRLATILWGAGTVIAIYGVAQEVWPSRPTWVWLITAVSAFNPHFLFLSSVVNNDAAITCLSTLVLWLLIRLCQGRTTPRTEWTTGLVLGLALLTKLSALALLPLVVLAIGLRWWQNRNLKTAVLTSLRIFPLASLVAGWWFIRNWLLYGDPLAWRVWLIDIGEHQISWHTLLAQFQQVGRSYIEPYDGLFPPVLFLLLAFGVAGAVAGWLLGKRKWSQTQIAPLLLTQSWFLLVFASLVRYMMTTPAAQGRLLFPAMASISLWLVMGIGLLLRERWQKTAVPLSLIACLGIAVGSLWAIHVRFPPARLTELPSLLPVESPKTADIFLAGIAQPETETPVDLTLYWQVNRPLPNLHLLLQLWAANGQLLAQWDRPPAAENYPPDLWQAGDLIYDPYQWHATPNATAYHLTAKLFTGDTLLTEATGPWLKYLPPVETTPGQSQLAYTVDQRIQLLGYDLSPQANTLDLTLYWQVVAPPGEDWQLFVHLLDANGQLLAQADGPPLQGQYPTSFWAAGEELADFRQIPLPTTWDKNGRIALGFYRLNNQTRLPVYAATGERLPDDAIPLNLQP